MPWDVNQAVAYARMHALPHSSGNCARFVRQAAGRGGVTLFPTHFAKDYGASLKAAGFVDVGKAIPMVGDIVVIQPIQGHPAGHMAIYDGDIWISDFKQYHGFYPGEAYRKIKPPYKIYRHP